MKKLTSLICALLLLALGLQAQVDDHALQLLNKVGDQHDYPGAEYLVLYDSTHVEMQETGLSFYNTHQLFKVLTPAGGRQLHTIRYGYDPMSAYAEIKKVIVYKKDGQELRFDLENEKNYLSPGGTILWGASEKLMDLGRLEPGDGVEVFLFKKGYTYALLQDNNDQQENNDDKYIPPMRGHFYDIIPFWVNQPTLIKYYQVDMPKSKNAQYKLYNGEGILKSKEAGSNGLHSWSFWANDLRPFKSEPNMVSVSDVAPKVLISTAPDWFAKSKWFYGVNEDFGSFETTPEISAKVNEILKGAKNELDSVSKLTHWVADEIRYFGLNMGPGEGYTLHTGDMTFTDRCGVCKDKAGLLVTMLRAAGFESYAAMTMAGSRIDYIPADQFNHSVASVRLSDGKLHMLDPTWVPFVRELWSSAEQQQNYLIGLPEGQDLQETAVSDPSNHYLKISIKSIIQPNGDLNCHMELTAEGQTDASFRRNFSGSNKGSWKQNLDNLILDYIPNAILSERSYSPRNIVQVLDGNIKLNYQFTVPQYAVVKNQEIIFIPLAFKKIFSSQQAHLGINTKLKSREFPFRESCSRQIEFEEEITFSQPISIAHQPNLESIMGTGASWTGSLKVEGNKLFVSQKADYKKRIYQPADWNSYRDAVLAQVQVSKEPIILNVK